MRTPRRPRTIRPGTIRRATVRRAASGPHPFAAVVLAFTVLGASAVPGTVAVADGADNDTIDGRFSGVGLVRSGEVLELDVAGRGGVAGDAAAVTLNVTATQTAGAGYATVFPCGARRPTASTINFEAGSTVANGVVAKVGDRGRICLYAHVDTHLLVDVTGYFPRTSDVRAVTPARLLDTRRDGATVDGRYAGGGRLVGGSVQQLAVAGRGGTHGAPEAIAVNVTITEPQAAGFATVFPCDRARPLASTINFVRGQTIANTVLTRVATDGTVCISTSVPTHVIADVTASLPSSAGYDAVTPARLLDTRPGQPTVDGRGAGAGRQRAGGVIEVDVAGRGGTGVSGDAVSLNLTATEAAAEGYATVFPCGERRPDASTINFGRGATVANGVVAKLGAGGRICIYTHAATHLVVDVDGTFGGPDYRPLTPARLLDTRPDAPPPPPPPAEVAAARSLEVLNALRARHGAGPVTLDVGMSAEALAWSREMSRSGFRHSNLGYAENIAWHSLASMSPTVAAETLHDMWVNSQAHFRNMIDPRWTRVGIGLWNDQNGWHGTHLFR